MNRKKNVALLITLLALSCHLMRPPPEKQEHFKEALENGCRAAEGFECCVRFVHGWLEHADPETGLIPRNLQRDNDYWNARDSAADNYPFMVLSAAMTDTDLFEGKMKEMLDTETRLTSRIESLPDAYSFSKKGFKEDEPDLGRSIFGASEYIKDGLLPVTEWLGKSPWSERMLHMLDDMWERAPLDTPYGKIVSDSHEINGEMMQVLSRVYWMTGRQRYLEWAVRLGDYYLLGSHHPTRDTDHLRLRDHGCEIVSGLCELYAAVSFAAPNKRAAYKAPLYEMLDRILEIGRNEHGLFYNGFNPGTGARDIRKGRPDVADTWGYTLNGCYTVFLLDNHRPYQEAVRKALENLNEHYSSFPWEGQSSDGYADSIEGAINLYNREQVRTAAEWIDREIRVMWSKQKPDGVIEGWHGDGNFARTTLLYCLWKTKGLTIRPWRRDVVFGAVMDGETLEISIRAEEEWHGTVLFDQARHKTRMKLPMDWPRINQFPEWFTVQAEKQYRLTDFTDNSTRICSGRRLINGIDLHLEPGVEHRIVVK